MQSKAPNRNRFWADLIVEELVRNGITTFFVAPGSRSTPLAMAVHDHQKTDVCVHFDERGTAFMALGYGKATRRPAGWITTSGTALANGFPAIVEADLECVPMILLTADRPPELRDTDSNQTIRQDHLFGRSVRWFVDLPTPSDKIDPAFVLTTIDQAVLRAATGPVHLNCMYREPLAPVEEAYSPIRSARFASWESGLAPFTRYDVPPPDLDANFLELESMLVNAERPLLVMGRMYGQAKTVQEAAEHLCMQWGAVCSYDIGSQARLGMIASGNGHGIAHLDSILAMELPDDLKPDCVIQFGATPVSKRLQNFIKSLQTDHYVVVDNRNRRIDPSHIASNRIQSDPVVFLQKWYTSFSTRVGNGRLVAGELQKRKAWQDRWKSIVTATESWLSQDVLGGALTEQATAALLSRKIPASSVLALGSSNPVRHMDSFADPAGQTVPVMANRGASGIDGTIASALGYAKGMKQRPVVFLGDLALLHDLNSLARCREQNAIVVVINNDGGGIFSSLPVRQFPEQFEALFGTPHGLSFSSAALMFGMKYERPDSVDGLAGSLDQAFSGENSVLIEVQTNREANLEEASRLLAALKKRLTSVLRSSAP